MRGGFTFKGIHSSVYGVRKTPTSEMLSPLKRRNLISIPGRSKAIIQQDGGYEPRTERMLCTYVEQSGVDIYQQVRNIAGWLSGVGELTYDSEPNLHYNAYVSSPPERVIRNGYAAFELEFTINHPFAYERATQLERPVGVFLPNNFIKILIDGTVNTPVKIIIKNNTRSTITDLKVFHQYIQTVEN